MITITTTLFISILLLREWSLASRIKQLMKVSVYKHIKIIDCFPCFSFWTSIIVAFFLNGSLTDVMAVYVIASLLDKLWN